MKRILFWPHRRIRLLTQRQRRIVAWVMLAVVISLGYARQETTISEERKLRQEYEASEEREDREEAQELQALCKIRNRALFNGRGRFIILRDNVVDVLADEPAEEQVLAEALFEGIVFDPTLEDFDCNGDGVLDGADYAP